MPRAWFGAANLQKAFIGIAPNLTWQRREGLTGLLQNPPKRISACSRDQGLFALKCEMPFAHLTE